jgi:hypothetical protein
MPARDGHSLSGRSSLTFMSLLESNLADLLLSSHFAVETTKRRIIMADKGLVEMFVEKFGGIREYWGYQVERVVYVDV